MRVCANMRRCRDGFPPRPHAPPRSSEAVGRRIFGSGVRVNTYRYTGCTVGIRQHGTVRRSPAAPACPGPGCPALPSAQCGLAATAGAARMGCLPGYRLSRRPCPVGRAALAVRGPLLPPGPVLQIAGAHARGGRRPVARHRLRPGHVRLRQERPGPCFAARRPRLRRLPADHARRPDARRRRVPWRQLFPRGGRTVAVRHVRARAGDRHRSAARGRISRLHRILAGAPRAAGRHAARLRVARFAQRGRRLPLRHPPRRYAGDGRAGHAVRAQADRAARHRTADQHVPVRRERSHRPRGGPPERGPPLARFRLAPGDPRFRWARHLARLGRMDLAAAGQPARAAQPALRRRWPARLWPAAARPQSRSLPGRRRVLREASQRLGRAFARLGRGRGGAGRAVRRRRDLRQHRRLLAAGRGAAGRPGDWPSVTG